MAKAGCSTCLRVILFCLNLFFCLCGAALIAVSMWGYYDDNWETELKAELDKDNMEAARQGFTGVVWFLFGVGVFVFLLGLLGCIGALTANRCILGFYVVPVFIIFLIGLGVGIFVLVCRVQIKNSFYQAVEDAYNTDSSGMATVGKRFCCGYGNTTVPNNPPPQSCNGQSVTTTCADALWTQLDRILMISGIVLIVALVVLALTIVLSCALCATVRHDYV